MIGYDWMKCLSVWAWCFACGCLCMLILKNICGHRSHAFKDVKLIMYNKEEQRPCPPKHCSGGMFPNSPLRSPSQCADRPLFSCTWTRGAPADRWGLNAIINICHDPPGLKTQACRVAEIASKAMSFSTDSPWDVLYPKHLRGWWIWSGHKISHIYIYTVYSLGYFRQPSAPIGGPFLPQHCPITIVEVSKSLHVITPSFVGLVVY